MCTRNSTVSRARCSVLSAMRSIASGARFLPAGDLRRVGVSRVLHHCCRRRAGEHRFGRHDTLEARAFGGGIIPAGIIGHGALVVAVCGAVGAGEIFHRISKVGVGIAQSGGIAGRGCGQIPALSRVCRHHQRPDLPRIMPWRASIPGKIPRNPAAPMTISVTHTAESASPTRGLLPLWVGVFIYALLLLAGNRLLIDPDTLWPVTV